jgi:cytochrome c1
MEPPAGVEIRDGMNYNPFFPGGAISMARVLFDGLVEYDDGQHIFFRQVTLTIMMYGTSQVLPPPPLNWLKTSRRS